VLKRLRASLAELRHEVGPGPARASVAKSRKRGSPKVQR
jgi:hypothetical protein